MTKAQLITDMNDGCRSPAEIARAIGCSEGYVRSKLWEIKNPERFRAYRRVYMRAYMARRRAGARA